MNLYNQADAVLPLAAEVRRALVAPCTRSAPREPDGPEVAMWWTAAHAEPPSIDAPLRTGGRADADIAVVVGVEDYAFVPDVPYARRDAEAVRQWLVYTRGIPLARVEDLVDPSREQVLAALDRARARVGAGGTVWVIGRATARRPPTMGVGCCSAST